MLEDELLKLAFIMGSARALARIYRKYADTLLTLAMALLNDANTAEDVVHDVFVRLAQSPGQFRLKGNLKSYLTTCLVNRVRDVVRRQRRRGESSVDFVEPADSTTDPVQIVAADELSQRAAELLATLPYAQREVITLHINAGMPFHQIAELQGASMRTIQGRYRYGLAKLRKALAAEVQP